MLVSVLIEIKCIFIGRIVSCVDILNFEIYKDFKCIFLIFIVNFGVLGL